MTAASIDIGSNTVLMLIAEIVDGKIVPLMELQRMPRISAGLSPGSNISETAEARLMKVLREYLTIISEHQCDKIFISATSAFRKGFNREKIKSNIEKLYNTEMKILSGDEEAEFAFLGTLEYGKEDEHRLVIDIGGGSTEIVYGNNSGIIFRKSSEVGVVSLSEKYFGSSKPSGSDILAAQNFVYKTLSVLPDYESAPKNIVALAGTPVTLACLKKNLPSYDESMVEGSLLTYDDVIGLKRYLSDFTPSELLNRHPGILQGRQDLILSGTIILLLIMDIIKADKVIVSTKGVRYGVLVRNFIEI